MAGWHTRVWRRMRVAPGVTVNLSKSGPSVSVGPRGSKVTFGRRGVRQTVGLPGTSLYATRQVPAAHRQPERPGGGLGATPAAPPAMADPAPAATRPMAPQGGSPAALSSMPDTVEVYYGLATVVGAVLGVALLIMGVPVGEAVAAAVIAIAVGIAYEGLAHHHPGPAKALVQVVVGLAAVASIILGVLGLVVVAAALGAGGSSGRRRRR